MKLQGPELTATLQNTDKSKPLQLKLTAYDGFIRLFVDEASSVARFQACRTSLWAPSWDTPLQLPRILASAGAVHAPREPERADEIMGAAEDLPWRC